MAYREVFRMEIQEIIRRWQAGAGRRQIAAGTGLSRNTVRQVPVGGEGRGHCPGRAGSHRGAVEPAGWDRPVGATAGGDDPSQDQLEPWADQIYQWIAKDRLQMTRIHELLTAQGMRLVVPVAASFRAAAELAAAQQDHGADGGHAAR